MTIAKLNNIEPSLWSSFKGLGTESLDTVNASVRSVGSVARTTMHSLAVAEATMHESSMIAKVSLANTYYSASKQLIEDHGLTEEQVQAWLLS